MSLNISSNITLSYAELWTGHFIPQNAILPSGYNFGFYAYMSEIGATGYTMSKIDVIS